MVLDAGGGHRGIRVRVRAEVWIRGRARVRVRTRAHFLSAGMVFREILRYSERRCFDMLRKFTEKFRYASEIHGDVSICFADVWGDGNGPHTLAEMPRDSYRDDLEMRRRDGSRFLSR